VGSQRLWGLGPFIIAIIGLIIRSCLMHKKREDAYDRERRERSS